MWRQALGIDDLLNERGYGSYDLKYLSIVYKTWKKDATDLVTTQHGIENVMNILMRTSKLVKQLEEKHINKTIILVSHGDPL